MRRRLFALSLCLWSALVFADYDAAPRRGSDLTGSWVLNSALSDDPEAMLERRLAEERQRFERWRREQEAARPANVPPPIDADAPPEGPIRSRGKQRPWQRQREENFRRMLAVSNTLDIRQQGSDMEIVSAVETRRLQAGSHSQVSMPEGQLADAEVGWDGDWFVIERRVRSGPRAVEKFRLVPKTGQLEYMMTWSGDTELAGMKIRRIFDLRTGPPPAPNPDSGPYIQ
jgi:hypothetical protein